MEACFPVCFRNWKAEESPEQGMAAVVRRSLKKIVS
jgi:hypothetical protein